MDAAGAAKLRRRIEQQQNWRNAQAVVEGRQPPIDPDLADLEEFADDLRLYSSRTTRDGGAARVCKRLVDGFWESGVIEERLGHDGAPAAQVA